MHATLLRYSLHDYNYSALFAQVDPLRDLIPFLTRITFEQLIMPINASTPIWFEGKRSGLSGWQRFHAEELRARLMRVAEKQKEEDRRRVRFVDEGETLLAKHGKNKMPKTFRELL